MINLDKVIFFVLMLSCAQSAVAEELTGTLGWTGVSTLGFTVSGIVESVNVQPGARVKKGQSLIQLEQRPFSLQLKKYKAQTETIEPLLFDSRIELAQAEELYDRTVLSQVELQKVEARHRGLQAQSRVAQMDHELAKWRLQKSSLKAPFDGVVIASEFSPGQVIARENKVDVALLLAPAGIMSVTIYVDGRQLAALPLQHSVKVVLGDDQLPGVVRQKELQAGANGLFRSVIEFKYPPDKAYYAGQTAKIIY